MRRPPPAGARGVELHPVAKRLAGEDVEKPEADHDLVALGTDRAGHERLGIGRLPADIIDRPVEAGVGQVPDLGQGEQAGAGQVRLDHAGDFGGQCHGLALGLDPQGDGHGCHRAFGDLDAQRFVLRQRRACGCQQQRRQDQGQMRPHSIRSTPAGEKVISISSHSLYFSGGSR